VTPPSDAGWYHDPPGGYEYRYWDGSGWRPDLTVAMDRMGRDRIQKFSVRRRLSRIIKLVSNDETVDCITDGDYYSWGNTTALVVLTDRRLLLLIGGRLLGRVRDYPLESISFEDSRWGGIKVIANGKVLRLPGADEIAHAIQDRRSGGRPRPAPPSRRDSYDLGDVTRWRGPDE
jgi:Protein of unknown function (DUF2510)